MRNDDSSIFFCHIRAHDLSPRHSEIYRIVSNKALENSGDNIRPTGGQTISVSQSPDDQQQGGKCC